MSAKIEQPKKNEAAVLVIDDDTNNLAIVSALLEEYSYTIYVAEDGESGISRALLTRPDLILLDVLMPGIDGFDTCQRLKSIEGTRDIPVIFMTALAETDQKVRGFEVGAVDYIIKPLHREEVLARVGVHLGSASWQRSCRMQMSRSRKGLKNHRETRPDKRGVAEGNRGKEVGRRGSCC